MEIEKLLEKALELPDGYHCEVYVRNGELEFSDWLNENEWTTGTNGKNYCGNIRSITTKEIIEMGYNREDIPDEVSYEDILALIGNPDLLSAIERKELSEQ